MSCSKLIALSLIALIIGALLSLLLSEPRKVIAFDGPSVKIVREGWLRNERRYEKDNIHFICKPIQQGKNYSFLIMGHPGHPYAGCPPVLARFPNGEIANLAQITTQSLINVVGCGSMNVSGESCAEIAAAGFGKEGTWPTNTLRISFEYWIFFVQNNTILSVFVWDYGEGKVKPALGNPETGEIYSFPLTQKQVIRIFGTPVVIREYFSE